LRKIDFLKHIESTGSWSSQTVGTFLDRIAEEEIKICIDSRKIKKGDIFLAIIGEEFDGHDYVNAAFKNGAAFCIVSKLRKYSGHCLFVDDTIEFIGKITASYFKENKPHTLAISGSNGKTTTKEWIKTILFSILGDSDIFVNQGNMNTEIGLPICVFNNFKNMMNKAVIEMGMSYKGDLELLSSYFQPDYALLTNIGSAHIGNMEESVDILACKRELTDSIGEKGTVILNADDPKLIRLSKEYGCKLSYFGFEENNSLTNKTVSIKTYDYSFKNGKQKTNIIAEIENEKFEINLDFFAHAGQISNLAAAITASLLFTDRKSLVEFDYSQIKPVKNRFEFHENRGNYLIDDFYNSSIESYKVALTMLDKLRQKDILRDFSFVIGSIAETGIYKREVHETLAKIIKQYNPGKVFIYSKNQDIKIICDYFPDAFVSDEKNILADKIKRHLYDAEKEAVVFKASRSVEMEDVYEIVDDFSD